MVVVIVIMIITVSLLLFRFYFLTLPKRTKSILILKNDLALHFECARGDAVYDIGPTQRIGFSPLLTHGMKQPANKECCVVT